MTKVLYVITKSNWGGAQKYVFNLSLAAKERGLEVAVAAGGEGKLITNLREVGIRVIPLPHLVRDIKPWADFLTFFDLVKIFKQERPDIIHLNSSKIGGLGALAGRVARVPKIIFTIHAWAFNEQRFILSRLLIALSHWVTILLAHQSIAVAEVLIKQIGIFPGTRDKIKTIHNGIEAINFLAKNDARQKLDLTNQDTIWLGTIAELHRNKGLDILLLAFKKVLEKMGGLNLIIIGEGEERENLARLITRYQLINNVHLVGQKEQAATLLKAFDLFTLPSRTEALPTVLLEAGSAGLPVIASNVGGIPEIIENNKEGALVQAENTHLLADKILELLANKKLMETYGKNLQQKITSHFSPTQMLDQTFALYQK